MHKTSERELSIGAKAAPEAVSIGDLMARAHMDAEQRLRISASAAAIVRRIRTEQAPTLMEHFLSEYGLSSQEGVALMCLAEAMLRVPDSETIDALIEDKIAPSNWGSHLGAASSSLVNASTWALMLTGRVLDDDQPGVAGILRGAIRRLGEPVVRAAVARAMRQMGAQFVLGETIGKALVAAKALEAKGYTYSYDMLGEAAMTQGDADRYAAAYADAISNIATSCSHDDVRDNPGISIKLSALHPRYEVSQEARVLAELVPVVTALARAARDGGMGLNIDAEEQDRLTLSLKVIEAVLSDPELAGWDGFGVVVQAYGKRAPNVIDWLNDLATRLDRKIMVRLVKGAYWDTEMKLAQVEGFADFPLFTSKVATDVSYIANARLLFSYSDRIYPQFATHNAHTVAAVLDMAEGRAFEFQRLHGMGERLHDIVLKDDGGRCRIYAPVGAHRDLLAYLVRRLLENGANSSFVNQIVDESVSPEDIASDPFADIAQATPPAGLLAPSELFGSQRKNSKGFDLTDDDALHEIYAAREVAIPDATSITVTPVSGSVRDVVNPANGVRVASVEEVTEAAARQALSDARPWDAPTKTRADVLRRAADLYEENYGLLFATLAKEAGKSLLDAVGELREAVDFLRYYADEAIRTEHAAAGTFVAISPWNFPLAIFSGQIAGALAVGNAVVAKPAEQTPLVAAIAVRLLHEAGVPVHALQLLLGTGASVGAALTASREVDGVVFTGSTGTAKTVRRSMARHMASSAPLIAETGGLNAMIVDSTALPEQAVRDIVQSAFQSAGQRCSALRCLYIQEDVAPAILEMVKGAMDQLQVGDPWHLSTDVGPVIDAGAQTNISEYISAAQTRGDVLYAVDCQQEGTFIAPTLISVSGIEALEREIFGPVLHVATYKAADLGRVVDAVNATGYGLTFGLHTRIDSRVQFVSDRIKVGNLYINRNQIGAVVGSQPFGGQGLSGTGAKAGGPMYLERFSATQPKEDNQTWDNPCFVPALVEKLEQGFEEAALETHALPGPTGEANTLTVLPRGPILCLGPSRAVADAQAKAVEALGGVALRSDGYLSPEDLVDLPHVQGVVWWGSQAETYAQALAQREGAILPLITGLPKPSDVLTERHLCVDVTAAGGNAALLAGQ